MIWNEQTAQRIIDEINEDENIPVREVKYEYNKPNKYHYLVVDGNTYEYNTMKDVINTLMLIQDNMWGLN